jgi:CelD/BcsL family acetyltransferase involved in cellulose biosynthesis
MLHGQDPLSTPFTSPGWVLAAWRHYAGGARPWIITVTSGDRLVGLAALAVRSHRGVRMAGPLAEALGDYWDVLAVPELRAEVLSAFARELRRRAGRDWDELVLNRLPARSPTAGALAAAGHVRPRGAAYPCPGMDLPPRFDAYLAGLPSRRRSNLVRHLRRLDSGAIALRTVEAVGEIPAAVDRWHALRVEQWREQGRDLHPLQRTDDFRDFVAAVLADLVPRGQALLWEFVADGRLAGSYVNFVDAGRFYWYLGGYDPATASLGIGKIAIGEGIRSSIAAGRGRYDFMIGAEPYKYWYGATDVGAVQPVGVTSRRPRSRAALGLQRARALLRS